MGSRGWFVAIVAALVVLHFVLRVGMGLSLLAPDLLTVALLLAATRMRAGWAAGLGVLLGLLADAVTFTVGAESLVYAVLGYLAARGRDAVVGEGMVTSAFYFFAGKLLHELLLFVVLWIGGMSVSPGDLFWPALLQSAYAAAAGLAALAAYRAVA